MPDCPPGKELCVRAERSGGIDLKSGILHLEGNVVGTMRSLGLSFSGDVLRAFRKNKERWERLVLERDVRLILQQRLLSPEEGAGTLPGDNGEGTVLKAEKAVLAVNTGRIELSGKVRVEQSDDHLRMEGETIVLEFNPDSSLESFQMDGKVVIAQPGRIISADHAKSRNRLSTILLEGNAAVEQKGAFDFKSERMEVYTDVDKGVLKSADEEKPITLTLDIAAGKSLQLTRGGMISLADKGLPPAILEKLAPLLGQRFDSQPAFIEAVERRLTPAESERYLETVLAASSSSDTR